jgi:hypothetical protein
MLRHRHTAEVLERLIVSGKRFLFNTAAEIMMPQPWAVDADGLVLGHLLTVDDAVFDKVAVECLVDILPMPEAFDRIWADLNQRTAWVETYAEALRALAIKKS